MANLTDDLKITAQELQNRLVRPDVIRIKLKEKLQLYALDFIYNNELYNHLIFYGGTCLRKCFNAGRMSEDIDFETSGTFKKREFAAEIKKHFKDKYLYPNVEAYVPGSGVSRVELRFPLLNEIGMSPHAGEKLILKIEVNNINQNYPVEFKTISEDRFSFVVKHYDLPTLMAGKMIACTERVWTKGKTGAKVKGRDYFDLIWYMQREIIPNENRLLDAKGNYTTISAFEKLAEKVKGITQRDLSLDLEALFEDGRFIKNWVANFHSEFDRLYCRYKKLI